MEGRKEEKNAKDAGREKTIENRKEKRVPKEEEGERNRNGERQDGRGAEEQGGEGKVLNSVYASHSQTFSRQLYGANHFSLWTPSRTWGGHAGVLLSCFTGTPRW